MKDDLISRQAAIDAFTQYLGRIKRDFKQWEGTARIILDYVPSAQPGCEDAVSRAEAVEALYDWEQMYTWDEHCKEDGGESPYIVSPSSIIEKLPPVTPKQPGWIPVTERLPRPNEEDGNGFYKAYLVQDGRWMDVARWDGKYWVAWGYSTVLLNVVAWCELPKPWEGGQDG